MRWQRQDVWLVPQGVGTWTGKRPHIQADSQTQASAHLVPGFCCPAAAPAPGKPTAKLGEALMPKPGLLEAPKAGALAAPNTLGLLVAPKGLLPPKPPLAGAPKPAGCVGDAKEAPKGELLGAAPKAVVCCWPKAGALCAAAPKAGALAPNGDGALAAPKAGAEAAPKPKPVAAGVAPKPVVPKAGCKGRQVEVGESRAPGGMRLNLVM